MFNPQSPTPSEITTPEAVASPEETPVPMTPEGPYPIEDTGAPGITDEDIQNHLDSLPDQEKAFLAEHLTPEFVRAIGLISGPEVATYLDRYADKDKVLVPVPRQIAEKYLAEQQGQQSAPPQGQPSAPPPQAPAGPAPQSAPMPPQAGGMMAPR